MNCEVIVNISRFNIQVFYSQNNNEYKAFKYEKSENIPFYVFSDGNDFEVGTSAKIKFKNHFDSSYYNYFNLIKDTKVTFPFLDGEDKKMSLLLIYSLEKILKELFQMLLVSEKVADVRDSLKLNLVLSSDISDVEINFLVNIFKEFGYNNCTLTYSNYLTLNYLDNNRKIGAFKDNKSNMGAFNGYIVIDAIGNDLQIDFFDSLVKKYPKFHEEGVGLASDPKVKIIAKELFYQTANSKGSLTKEETEIPHLIPLAQKYVNSNKAEFRVKVVLTDGATKNVKMKMSSINEKASYLSNFTKDFDLVKTVVKQSKIGNTDLAFVIKSSVNSNNFIDNLKSTYNNIYHSKDEFVDILELFIDNEKVINQGDFVQGLAKPKKPVVKRTQPPDSGNKGAGKGPLVHSCSKCKKTFPTSRILDNHTCTKASPKPGAKGAGKGSLVHKCTKCEKTFPTSRILDNHTCAKASPKPGAKGAGKGSLVHKCSKCKKTFPTSRILDNHACTKAPPKPAGKSAGKGKGKGSLVHKCSKCQKTFPTSRILLAHDCSPKARVSNPVSKSSSVHKCSKCKKTFPTSRILLAHDCLSAKVIPKKKK